MSYVNVLELLNEVLIDIQVSDDEIIFSTANAKYKMFHQPDCCESVYIEDIEGDMNDLIGNPLLQAEEVSAGCLEEITDPVAYTWMVVADKVPSVSSDESQTWTFYKFATIKGSVTIRWYGSSNGYYSESVDFVRIK